MINVCTILDLLKTNESTSCQCVRAIYDETEEEVSISGGLSNFENYTCINLIAVNTSGIQVWSISHDVGRPPCILPFEPIEPFTCDNNASIPTKEEINKIEIVDC